MWEVWWFLLFWMYIFDGLLAHCVCTLSLLFNKTILVSHKLIKKQSVWYSLCTHLITLIWVLTITCWFSYLKSRQTNWNGCQFSLLFFFPLAFIWVMKICVMDKLLCMFYQWLKKLAKCYTFTVLFLYRSVSVNS